MPATTATLARSPRFARARTLLICLALSTAGCEEAGSFDLDVDPHDPLARAVESRDLDATITSVEGDGFEATVDRTGERLKFPRAIVDVDLKIEDRVILLTIVTPKGKEIVKQIIRNLH